MMSEGARRRLALASLATSAEVLEAGTAEEARHLVVAAADRMGHLIRPLHILDMTQAHPTSRTISLATILAMVGAATLHTGEPRLLLLHPQIRMEETMVDMTLTVRDMELVHMSKIRGVKVR